MTSRILISLALVATLLNMGCTLKGPKYTTHVRFESPVQARLTLESNLRTLRSVSTQLDEIRKDFIYFHRPWRLFPDAVDYSHRVEFPSGKTLRSTWRSQRGRR